jgi:hypothetical protein
MAGEIVGVKEKKLLGVVILPKRMVMALFTQKM